MDEPQKELDLMVKMLNMTTASDDNIALVAIRKANAHLAKLGGSWDNLLRGKLSITVIEDPFKNLSTPPPRDTFHTPRQAPSPRPASPQLTSPRFYKDQNGVWRVAVPLGEGFVGKSFVITKRDGSQSHVTLINNVGSDPDGNPIWSFSDARLPRSGAKHQRAKSPDDIF